MTTTTQPKTGQACTCRPGQDRDNCSMCEGTGQRIDFAAIRALPLSKPAEPARISGQYRTNDGKAQIEWRLEQKEKGLTFSASGQWEGSYGQNIDEIAKAYPKDEQVQRIAKVWEVWHLNDMRAGCQHQRAQGWGREQIEVVKVELHLWRLHGESWENDKRDAEMIFRRYEAISGAHKDGTPPVLGGCQSALGFAVKDACSAALRGEVYKPKPEQAPAFAPARGVTTTAPAVIEIRTEKRYTGHTYAYEHPRGVLCKPCPECGYRYGSAWLFEPIPEDVLAEIKLWSKLPQAEGTLQLSKARAFMAKYDVKLRISLSDTKAAPWEPAGHHYRCTLSQARKRLTFDWWGSVVMAGAGEEPDAGDIFSTIASEIECPSSFEEFCSAYGYEEDSIKAKQLFNRCDRFADRLRSFFSGVDIDEITALRG